MNDPKKEVNSAHESVLKTNDLNNLSHRSRHVKKSPKTTRITIPLKQSSNERKVNFASKLSNASKQASSTNEAPKKVTSTANIKLNHNTPKKITNTQSDQNTNAVNDDIGTKTTSSEAVSKPTLVRVKSGMLPSPMKPVKPNLIYVPNIDALAGQIFNMFTHLNGFPQLCYGPSLQPVFTNETIIDDDSKNKQETSSQNETEQENYDEELLNTEVEQILNDDQAEGKITLQKVNEENPDCNTTIRSEETIVVSSIEEPETLKTTDEANDVDNEENKILIGETVNINGEKYKVVSYKRTTNKHRAKKLQETITEGTDILNPKEKV